MTDENPEEYVPELRHEPEYGAGVTPFDCKVGPPELLLLLFLLLSEVTVLCLEM
jgi:hypothetical protein